MNLKKHLWTTGVAAAGMAALTNMAPGLATAKSMTTVTEVTNWFAEPEQGGQWDAQLNGYFKEQGLDMTTKQGGPQVSDIPLVAAGKVTFGMASADSILQARAQGIPIVAIFTDFQIDPQVLIWHAGQPIMGFPDLNGHPVYVSGSSPYWQYLLHKYHLTKAQTRSYTGSLVNFVQDPKAVTQGYVTEEPYTLSHQGVKVKYELVADSGFDPYQNLMFTTEKEIQEHPDVVRAFVKASRMGWENYLAHPEATDNYMKTYSPDLIPAAMLFAVKQEAPLIEGGSAKVHGIGYMTAARWNLLAAQMKQTGMLPKNFSASGAFTDKFLS